MTPRPFRIPRPTPSRPKRRRPFQLEHPFPTALNRPRARWRAGMAEHFGPGRFKRPAGQVCVVRFLDLLLHQLHAHFAGIEKARASVSEQLRCHRRPLRQVRYREDAESIREAIMRYEIEHPVVNDADHKIWNSYAVPQLAELATDRSGRKPGGANSGEFDFEASTRFSRISCRTIAKRACSMKSRCISTWNAAKPANAAALSRKDFGR